MRSVEGKAEGLEAVVMVLLEESCNSESVSVWASGSVSFFGSIFIVLWDQEDLEHTFILRAADFACEVGFAGSVGFEEVAAVGAEDERSNGCHGDEMNSQAVVCVACECAGS